MPFRGCAQLEACTRTMRILLALLLAITVCSSSNMAMATKNDKPLSVLFVGNSLTYVGNLPAVLDALATVNGRLIVSSMLAKGGATLMERVADGSVESALDAHGYDYVVLQERGGDYVCAFGPTSCDDARVALKRLVDLARKHGAIPILLGTYQSLPGASRAIVEAEQRAAKEASVAYVSVSDRLQAGRTNAPTSQWFYSDGKHPGHDLVLLEATLLFSKIAGCTPSPSGFIVHAAMYGPQSHFLVAVVKSTENAAKSEANEYSYDTASVAIALDLAVNRTSSVGEAINEACAAHDP
jgi:hypothetical protein